MTEIPSQPANTPLRVAIIGAGLTGLLVAQGLQKNGFSVANFDREPSIDARLRDWTIVIHWALPTMAKLLPEAVLADLPRAICNPHLDFAADGAHAEALPCYNGITGELLFKSPLPGSRRVSRQRLRRVLAQGVDVRWGKVLTGLEVCVRAGDGGNGGPEREVVRLAFADGSSYEADFVLGADGSSSKVREMLLGAELARVQGSGFMFATCIVKYNDAAKIEAIEKAHPVAAITLGSSSGAGSGVMYVDDPKDKSTWTAFWVKFWPGSPVNLDGRDALSYLKEHTEGLAEPWQSLVDDTPEGSTCYIDEMKYWVPVSFDNRGGRVTLAGDAVHPMLIYRGQGFQHAIMDASNYVDALLEIRAASSSDAASVRQSAMAAYGDEVVERGAGAVTQSVEEAKKSIDLEMVGKMLMAKQGHGRSA